MNAPPGEAAPPSPLAALLAALQDGNPVGHGELHLALVDEARAKGATWGDIARVLRYPSGRAAKRAAHKLRDAVRRSGHSPGPA